MPRYEVRLKRTDGITQATLDRADSFEACRCAVNHIKARTCDHATIWFHDGTTWAALMDVREGS